MRYIVRAMSSRPDCIEYLRRHLPEAEFRIDTPGNAMEGFLDAMQAAGPDPGVHLEEDIYLTRGFTDKIESVVAEHPDEVIQFFSMRGADLKIGSRHEPGRTFMMNQCFYLPAGYSEQIHEYYPDWPQKPIHPTGYDILIADFLRSRGERYWLSVPSLVDHRPGRSLINSRRPQNRQSLTFTEGIYG